MPNSRRRWLIASIILFLVVTVVGVVYVFHVADGRAGGGETPATEDEVQGLPETELRSLLDERPSHDRARFRLIQVLAESARIGEAEELARFWLEDPAKDVLGFRALSELAVRRLAFDEALRFARQTSDRDPMFAQSMQMHVHDLVGTPTSRERSAAAAETIGTLASSADVATQAFLYAAETLRDLERSTTRRSTKDAIRERWRRDQKRAHAALVKSSVWNDHFPRSAAAKMLKSKINLLWSHERDQLAAQKELEGFLAAHPDDHDVRSSLIRHHLDQERVAEALALMEEWTDAPAHVYLRMVGAVAPVAALDDVLTLLDAVGSSYGSMLELVRARLLVEGDPQQREEGVRAFERLAHEHRTNWSVVRECHARVRAAGEPRRALSLLDGAGAGDQAVAFSILLERVAEAVRSGGPDQAVLLSDLASKARAPDLIRAFRRLRLVPGAGDTAALALFDAALSAQSVHSSQVRLMRAAAVIGRPGTGEQERSWWIDRGVADLTAISKDTGASRRVLVDAATVAASADRWQLAGRLLGRALATTDQQGDVFGVFVRGASMSDTANRTAMGAGLRETPLGEPVGGWIRRLADALASGDLASLRRPSGSASATQGVLEPTELLLQVRLAARDNDWPQAISFARQILAKWPSRSGGKERLAATMLAAGELEEVLAVHSGTELSLHARAQRIDALRRLGRRDEALAAARLLLRETNGSDRALLVLAQLLKSSDPDAALAAISPLAGSARADLMRADLFEERGDADAAALIYKEMLRRSENRDLAAWTRLAALRAAQDRTWDFIREATATIDAPSAMMGEREIAGLVLLRGQARERAADYAHALQDYRRVIHVPPSHPAALNNAAWLLATQPDADPGSERRLERALDLANRAVQAASDVAAIRHTRSRILALMDRHQDALRDIEKALLRLEQGINADSIEPSAREKLLRRRARYRLDKASLLEALGREDEARQLYALIQQEAPHSVEGRQAGVAADRIGK